MARPPGVMDHDRVWLDNNAITGEPEAATQIYVLVIEKKLFIKST